MSSELFATAAATDPITLRDHWIISVRKGLTAEIAVNRRDLATAMFYSASLRDLSG